MDSTTLLAHVKADGVKFVSLQFTDVTGAVKSVDIPTHRLEGALEEGIWFDGSSVEGFARIQESDMRLVIDKNTYSVLPWSAEERRRGRVFCDIFMPDGKPFPGDPRGTLKRILSTINERGWTLNIGPEPEFFLFKRNGPDPIHPVPHDVGGYFDFSASDEALRVRAELMDALSTMGLQIEMGHHEVALGQHEIDFRYTNAVEAADNILTMKYTVKAIAAKHGLIASFMPKPIYGINGSGMHCHQSLFDKDGNNLFYNANDEFHLSEIAYGYIAGQLNHARALAARIPRYMPGRDKAVRAELRCPDPTANPYLAITAMLAAGLDGIENKITCPAPLNNVNVYHLSPEERIERNIDSLPGSLTEAMRELDKDAVLKDALGTEIYAAFERAKWAEIEEYRTRVSDWEIERYLETA